MYRLLLAFLIGSYVLLTAATAKADEYWQRQSQRTANQAYWQGTNRFIQGQQQQLMNNFGSDSGYGYGYKPYVWQKPIIFKNPYETTTSNDQYTPYVPPQIGAQNINSPLALSSIYATYKPSASDAEANKYVFAPQARKFTAIKIAGLSMIAAGIGVCVGSLIPMADGHADTGIGILIAGAGTAAVGGLFLLL